jgi:hypothetical protein
MLENLFYTISSYGRFMSVDHPVDVMRVSLEYVPRVPSKYPLLFLFFLSIII